MGLKVLAAMATLVAAVAGTTRKTTVYACTAPVGGHPSYSVEVRTDRADIVFVGRVVGAGAESPLEYVEVAVGQYLKGRGWSTVEIGPFGSGALCLNHVEVGERYIFFARGSPFEERLQAYYASAYDAIASATDEHIRRIVEHVGHPPTAPIHPEDVMRIFVPFAIERSSE